MSDFFQNGIITTLHNLRDRPLQSIEDDLHDFALRRPMALVLPCLYSELERPALKHIVRELSGAGYVSQIIIGLEQATEAQYRHALEYFSVLPQVHHVLWNDGPRLQQINAQLTADEVDRLMKGEKLSKPTVSDLLAEEARKAKLKDTPPPAPSREDEEPGPGMMPSPA